MVGLALLRRRRRAARGGALQPRRPAPERGQGGGRARRLAARRPLPARLRPRAGRRPDRRRAGRVRMPLSVRALAHRHPRPRPPLRASRGPGPGAGPARGGRGGRPPASPAGPTRSSSPRVSPVRWPPPLRAAGLAGGDDPRGGRAAVARRRGDARPLLGRARLAVGPVLALVRDGRGPGQLRDAQQRGHRGRRRERGRLPDETAGWRRSRAATRSRSWTRISAASAASPPAPGTSWAATSSYAARR